MQLRSKTVPLKLNEQGNLFKLFLNDIGLLASQYASGIQMKLLNDEISVNYGAIYENLVAQELAAHGFGGTDHCTYYFSNKRQGELDFIIEHDGMAIPIEVKSGKDFERHNALSNVLSNPDYAISKAYVLCNGNFENRGKIIYAPIYMTMFIERKQPMQRQIFRIEMTALK